MNTDMIGLVSELDVITKEIKTRLNDLSKLRKREKTIKEQIKKFCSETDKPGIKYKDITILVEDKTKRVPKKIEAKIKQCKELLQENDIQCSDKIITQVIDALKGEKKTQKIIKIVKKNKN